MKLPALGIVYLDTQAIIYSVEAYERYRDLIASIWLAAQECRVKLISSELAVMETLVGPLKRGDQRIQAAYEDLFLHSYLTLIPITQPTLREAAQLRARHPALRTPDAIHAATAKLSHCAAFVTNDRDYQRITGLSLLILDDYLNP